MFRILLYIEDSSHVMLPLSLSHTQKLINKLHTHSQQRKLNCNGNTTTKIDRKNRATCAKQPEQQVYATIAVTIHSRTKEYFSVCCRLHADRESGSVFSNIQVKCIAPTTINNEKKVIFCEAQRNCQHWRRLWSVLMTLYHSLEPS